MHRYRDDSEERHHYEPPRRGGGLRRFMLTVLIVLLAFSVVVTGGVVLFQDQLIQLSEQQSQPSVGQTAEQKPSVAAQQPSKTEAPTAAASTPTPRTFKSPAEIRAEREKAAAIESSKTAVKQTPRKESNGGGSFFIFDALGWVVGLIINILVAVALISLAVIIIMSLGKATIPEAVKTYFGWWRIGLALLPFVGRWLKTKTGRGGDDDDDPYGSDPNPTPRRW